MNEQEQRLEQLAALVRETAGSYPYPPTPDIASQVRNRLAAPPRPRPVRLAWAAAALLVALGLLLAVPQVRAAVFDFIRAGAILIFAGEPTETPAVETLPAATALPMTTATPAAGAAEPIPEERATLQPLATAVFEPSGLTTLEEALAQAGFALRLPPAYGPPDEVYLDKVPDPGLDGQVVILVWRDPDQPERARLRLDQIGLPFYGIKRASIEAVTQTEVNGQAAFWIEGEHEFQFFDERAYFVEGNVLIWETGEVTYRLESDLSLTEAVQVAESLQAIKGTE